MPEKPAKMPILDHLNELRKRLTVVVVVLLAATIALYIYAPQLIWFLMDPIAQYLPDGDVSQLNVLNPLGGFTLRFQIAFVAAVLATCPVWIWHMFAFFMPALEPEERKWVVPTFFAGLALFAAGAVFCYFVILDPAFGWLLEQVSGFGTVFPDAYFYVHLILMFELSFGIAFELPLIVFYLLVFRIVPYKKLRSSWRIVYIVLMVVCAAVTPDASPVTMLLLFAAMISLYEVSLGLARMVLNKRIAAKPHEGSEEM